MKAHAQARASAISLGAQQRPVLKAHALLGSTASVGALMFFATLPHRAAAVVAELAKYEANYVLDEALAGALRTARLTVARFGSKVPRTH